MKTIPSFELPGLNCGSCGYHTCDDFSEYIKISPDEIKRCIHLSGNRFACKPKEPDAISLPIACGDCSSKSCTASIPGPAEKAFIDSLGREFDFYLEHFPEDPGPREIIIPRNPIMTRELNVLAGDVLIGRPLGMSCGCPVTHCGVATAVDKTSGVITWCVTGPLRPRAEGFKDLGFYSAEAYEGIITEQRYEIKIGMRYYFQPRMCMLQWRHSGLVNFINRTPKGIQVRLEGLFIG